MPKISALTAATALTADDLLVAIDDPAGTPTAKKITAANAAIYFGGTVNNVKSYGATGDGSTDDTTAVQNALAAGGITFFPLGVYLVGTLTLPEGAHLVGQQSGHSYWDGAAYQYPFTAGQTSQIKRKNSTDARLLYLPTTALRVILEDLDIFGNNANQSVGAHIIDVADSGSALDTHLNILRCWVHGWTDPASKGTLGGNNIYIGTSRQACHVTESIITHSGAHGVQVQGSDGNVTNCVIGDSSYHGIVASSWVIKLVNNDIYNSGLSGIYVTSGVRRIMIVANGIDRTQQHGIYVDTTAQGVSISSNQFSMSSRQTTSTYSHIYIATTTGMVNVIGNTFSPRDNTTDYPNEAKYGVELAASATAFEAGNNYVDDATAANRSAALGYCNDTSRLYITARPAFRESQQLWMSDATAGVAQQGLDLPSALTEFDATWAGTRRTLTPTEGGREAQITVRGRKITSSAASTVVVSIRDVSDTANILCSVSIVTTNTASSNWEGLGTWTTVGSWFSTASPSKTVAIYFSGGNGADDWVFRDITLKWRG